MQIVKLVSKVLFYITRFFCFFYVGMALDSLIALSTGWGLTLRENNKFFGVCVPFTKHVYLVGDYNLPYIIFDFILPLSLYGLFFLLLSNVFKVFFQPKLFTTNSIKHLKIFYLSNIIVPAIAVSLSAVFSLVDDIAFPLIFFHLIIGIFAFFLASIFSQGVHLQKEQDLFI